MTPSWYCVHLIVPIALNSHDSMMVIKLVNYSYNIIRHLEAEQQRV